MVVCGVLSHRATYLSVVVFDHLLLSLSDEYPCHFSRPNPNRFFFFFFFL